MTIPRTPPDAEPMIAFVAEMRAALDRMSGASSARDKQEIKAEMGLIMRRYLGPGRLLPRAARKRASAAMRRRGTLVDWKMAQAGEERE